MAHRGDIYGKNLRSLPKEALDTAAWPNRTGSRNRSDIWCPIGAQISESLPL
jgi:hypothetical protein